VVNTKGGGSAKDARGRRLSLMGTMAFLFNIRTSVPSNSSFKEFQVASITLRSRTL
jgi:hypothetical protein